MRGSRKKWYLIAGLVAIVALAAIIATGCAATDVDMEEPMVSAENCGQCHNDTTLVLAKRLQWDASMHAMGTSYGRSTSASCAGCHSSEGKIAMVDAGMSSPAELTEGITNPTPPNCRGCHEIHETYTSADWALRTEDPVTLYATGATFDMGEGNLCASCHQSRRQMVVENGMVNVSSTHWGPHHGPQSDMLLGLNGAGVSGTPSVHYMVVTEGCPTCHMVNDRHEMEANITSCQSCHADSENFDIGGVQTEVEALIEELAVALSAKHMLETAEHEPYHAGVSLEDLHPVVGEYTEAEAGALWNYIMIQIEDGSNGVHNPKYTIELLETSIAALK
ncbi:cytochrome c3 family protein [Chloroflexota bacterium]